MIGFTRCGYTNAEKGGAESLSDIRTRIQSWRNEEISDVRLLRDLVEHERWYLPVANQSVAGARPGDDISPAIRFSRNQSGEKVFCVFSDMAAFNLYQARLASATGPDAAMEADGAWLFSRVLDDFASVVIDPHSPHQLTCERPQFKLLNDTANGVRMERTLKSLHDGGLTGEALAAGLSSVKNYQNFYVVLTAVNGAYAPVMYRSDNNVPLLAVFTGKDNARLFYEQMNARFPGTYSYEQHTGLSIAEGVIGSNFQGLVFNPGVFAEPVAFASKFAHLVQAAQ